MGIKAEVHTGSGDSGAMLAEEGVHRAVLAEVVDLGKEKNKWGKTPQRALAIFELPENLCGDDAIDGRQGTPKQVLWWINNLAFSAPDSPGFRTDWEKLIATWFGKSVPPELHYLFVFGRDYGDGEDDLKAGLKGAALKKQRAEKPGVPIGAAAMLRVVHRKGKDDRTYPEPAPALPPDDIEPGELAEWVPGLAPPDEKAKTYAVSESYEPWAERKKSSGGEPSGQAQAAEEEDDEIPF